jgi:hypothetical protein
MANALVGKLDANSWIDISLLSTINGFSSITTRVIKYLKIGRGTLYYYNISGASSAANFTFTIHTNHLGETYFTAGGLNQNGGNFSNNASRITVTANSNVISIQNTLAGSTWGGAGTKSSSGWFIIEENL